MLYPKPQKLSLTDEYLNIEKLTVNGQEFEIGPLVINPFSIPHDTSDPVGYLVKVRSKSEEVRSAEYDFYLKATKNVLPRALALDMGATLTSLRRVKQWKFELKDAVPFDKILNTSPADFASLVLPVSAVLRA